ncbi:hypothetical protein SDC9_110298 [bioreactor metagenome]|uniref:Uncharacterized protein n=1 Tax=bioreactor metagenome TaxID=1076179 RepID=A0A645BED6_9ZZZZ
MAQQAGSRLGRCSRKPQLDQGFAGNTFSQGNGLRLELITAETVAKPADQQANGQHQQDKQGRDMDPQGKRMKGLSRHDGSHSGIADGHHHAPRRLRPSPLTC